MDALKETARLRHQNSDPMLRATRIFGNHLPEPFDPRFGSGIYPRFILHNGIYRLLGQKGREYIATEIAGEGLLSISLPNFQT